jgi:hypothetical protein
VRKVRASGHIRVRFLHLASQRFPEQHNHVEGANLR